MNTSIAEDSLTTANKTAEGTIFPILLAISFSHLLNDTIQSLIPSIYPIVKHSFRLTFAQVGIITLTFQLAASLLQLPGDSPNLEPEADTALKSAAPILSSKHHSVEGRDNKV